MTDPVRQIYQLRFSGQEEYRTAIWKILVKKFFSKWIPRDATVLDLGCGYGEFINNIENSERHGMDLNPDSLDYLDKKVVFHPDSSFIDMISPAGNKDRMRELFDQKVLPKQAQQTLQKEGILWV